MTKSERENLKVIGNLLQIMFEQGLPFKWAVEFEAACEAYKIMGGPPPNVGVHPESRGIKR